MKSLLGILGSILSSVLIFFLLLWGTLAIYFSNLPIFVLRVVLSIIFLVFGVWAIWISRQPKLIFIFAIAYVGLIFWWLTIKPSHKREWRPEVAVMPRATINGDTIHISGYRNFVYKSYNDFTVRLEERDYLLSHLTSVDFFISYWHVGPVGHTFVSFNFDNALPLCISIETRPEVGEGFAPIASLFKQFELIYVVGDERDIVGVRTNHRHEEVYLYPIRIAPENARKLLLIYLSRVNQLADHPEFYHLLSNNCTINIVRYANKAGRKGRFYLYHFLNGFIDQYLYYRGFINTKMPFEELRKLSKINDVAQAGEAEHSQDFSKNIRANLPKVEK
ncbi:hypothetical protein MYP_4607 [Sporocytophaga myxococcoides]|uniref:Lnb N-terminal periplasmic domain-containing protein n=1 Tax=Sporocytophaga myxococcoides TaxID=153721 RepID=A0A098LM22_9BACT|nr:DUF4105 domain-containing protein [Sporocytophaga myxococcoides]GAL87377.1 hypothetical protein MYP_4607 [Sporocytophaga myxococcoides]